MCGADTPQEDLSSVRNLKERIPHAHPLRKLRAVVDVLLHTMDTEFPALYTDTGRESIQPVCLPPASLLQVRYVVCSEPSTT